MAKIAKPVNSHAGAESGLNAGLATTPRVLGHSRDCRTQRWMVTCPKCDKQFEPQTTRLSWQSMQCPKCGIPLSADYNAEPPVVMVDNVELSGREEKL